MNIINNIIRFVQEDRTATVIYNGCCNHKVEYYDKDVLVLENIFTTEFSALSSAKQYTFQE